MAISGKLDSRHEYPSNLNRGETPVTKLTYRKGVLVCSSGNERSVSRSTSGSRNINSGSSGSSFDLRQPPPLPLLQQTQSSSVRPSSNNSRNDSRFKETNTNNRKSATNNFSSSPNSTVLINSSCTCSSTGNNNNSYSNSSKTTKNKESSSLLDSSQNKSFRPNSTPTCNNTQQRKNSTPLLSSTKKRESSASFKTTDSNKGESPICTRKFSGNTAGNFVSSKISTQETNKEFSNTQNHRTSSPGSKIHSKQPQPFQKSFSPAEVHGSLSSANTKQPTNTTNKLASSPSCTRNLESSSSMACVNGNRSQQNLHNRHHSHSNLYQSSMGHNHNHNNQNHSYFDFEYDHINNLTQSLQNNSIHNHNQHNSSNGFLHNQSNNSSMSQNQNTNRESRIHQQVKPEFIPSFVLVDACKANNERKVREIVRKLSNLDSTEVEPVANFQDNTGRTALSYACASGNIMIIEELSKLRRLDSNLADNEGMAPLHYCSQAGHSEAVDLMLSRFEGNVDPNVRNATGLTPLMKAALQGRTRCAKSLLAAGASSHLRDYSRNLTAAEWATFCGRHICAEIINRSAKDNYKTSGSPPASFPHHTRNLPGSQNGMELKRMNSDDSPYYHLYARNTISGATWLKNKIKKALGASGVPGQYSTHHSNGNVRSLADRRPTVSDATYGLMSNLSGATICAGSLLLPSIKPLIEQQRAQPRLARKMTIPVLQVTPVKR